MRFILALLLIFSLASGVHAAGVDVVVRYSTSLGNYMAYVPGFRLQIGFPVGGAVTLNVVSLGPSKPDYGVTGLVAYFATSQVDRFNITFTFRYTTLLNTTFGLMVDSGGSTVLNSAKTLFGNIFIFNFLVATVPMIDVAAKINEAVQRQRDFDLVENRKLIDNPDPDNPGLKQLFLDLRDTVLALAVTAIVVAVLAFWTARMNLSRINKFIAEMRGAK